MEMFHLIVTQKSFRKALREHTDILAMASQTPSQHRRGEVELLIPRRRFWVIDNSKHPLQVVREIC